MNTRPEHISYHPVRIELARTFASFTLSEGGADLARDYCSLRGLDDLHANRLLELLPHYALRTNSTFDQTHGFHTAVLQGFFDPFFYVHQGSLSALGDLLDPYTQSWHEIVEGSLAETANNQLSAEQSSGVFISADKVAQFMTDTHEVPELTQALGVCFPGTKAQVLWTALQTALDSGSGLLEASGVVVPHAADLQASECYAKFTNCDAASLQFYIDAYGVPMTATAVPHPAPPTLVQSTAPAAAATKAVTRGGLAERLRAKRLEPQAPTIPPPAPAAHVAPPEPASPAEMPPAIPEPASPAEMPPAIPEPAVAELVVPASPAPTATPTPAPVKAEVLSAPEAPAMPDESSPVASADPLGDLHMQLASTPPEGNARAEVAADVIAEVIAEVPADTADDREIPDAELIELLLGTLDAAASKNVCSLSLVPDHTDGLTAVAGNFAPSFPTTSKTSFGDAFTPWVAIVPAGSEDRITLDVNDFVGEWEPFSAIETGIGTAVVRYQQSEDIDALRVFGVHVDTQRPLQQPRVATLPTAFSPNHLALVSVAAPLMHCPAQGLVSS